MDALKDQSITWHTVITGTEPTQAAAIIRRELEQNPAIEAILGTGQADTEGSGLAVSELDPPRALFIAGFDLSPQILDYLDRGIIAASVDQQPYCQGFYPVVQLTLYCRYGIWPSNLDAGATIICQANAGQIIQLSQDGIR
jgi:simple sugar transport system substrate-binding protein